MRRKEPYLILGENGTDCEAFHAVPELGIYKIAADFIAPTSACNPAIRSNPLTHITNQKSKYAMKASRNEQAKQAMRDQQRERQQREQQLERELMNRINPQKGDILRLNEINQNASEYERMARSMGL